MKKIGKAIAKKFKNWKTTTSKETVIQEPKISSREEAKKPLEITIEHQPTVITAKTTTAKDENSKEIHERPLTQQKKVITINPELKAKLVDDLVWEEECKDSLTIEHTPSIGDSEVADNQLIYEKSATALIETDVQEPNTPGSPSEPCFDATDEKDKPLTQQRQAILAGVVGAALLASGAALYIIKMPVVAAVVGIVGLACIDTVSPVNKKIIKIAQVTS